MTFNYISGWLYLIGTPARAAKLRLLLPRLSDVTKDEQGQIVDPPFCPTIPLFGFDHSHFIYASMPELRPALDAWDSGILTKSDLLHFCKYIESGQYDGPIYTDRPISWLFVKTKKHD